MKYASLPSTPSNHTQPDNHAMELEELATQNGHMKEMQEMQARLAEVQAKNAKLQAELEDLKSKIEVPKQKPPPPSPPPPPPPRQNTIKHRNQRGQPKPPHPFGAERARLLKQMEAKDKQLEAKDKEIEAKNKKLKEASDRIGPALNYYKEKCQTSQRSRRDLQQKVDTLKEEVATLRARATSEQTKRELAEESVQRYKKQLEQAQAKINEADLLAADAAKIAQERLDTTRTKMVIHSRFDCCGNKGNIQNQRREVTSAQVEGALEKLGNAINSLSTARQHYRAANTQNTLDKEEIRKLKEQVCSLDGQLKSMRMHNSALQTRLTDARHNLELAELACDKAMGEQVMVIRRPTYSVDDGTPPFQEAHVSVAEVERLYQENDEHLKRNTNLARELQDCRQKLGQRATTISDLNIQIGDLVTSKQQLENTNQELVQRIKAFEQVVSTVHTISSDLAEKSKSFVSR